MTLLHVDTFKQRFGVSQAKLNELARNGIVKIIPSGCDVCGLKIEVGQPIVKIGFGRYHADCVDWSN